MTYEVKFAQPTIQSLIVIMTTSYVDGERFEVQKYWDLVETGCMRLAEQY